MNNTGSKLPNHLGGHKNRTHLDHGVLNFMIKTYNIKSMIDIGCGPGGMLGLAEDLGIESHGIDGDFTIDRGKLSVEVNDYTLGPSNTSQGTTFFDLAWSCEFVEHVDEKYIPNYIKDFQLANYVVMTFSEKPGHHHVNIKPKEYWIETFENYSFQFDEKRTQQIRNASTMNTEGKFAGKKDFVKTNGLFFINTNQK